MTHPDEQGIASLRSAFAALPWSDAPGLSQDDLSFGLEVAPEDEKSLGDLLAAAGDRGLSFQVRGGGNRLGMGNLAPGADALLSTRGFSGVRNFEPDDGVIEVGGGTPLAEIREAIRGSGWELALDAAGAGSTAGGVIASAAAGPRNLGFGPVRRAVLGLDVVLATGERTRCGGRVVKNVTGYDLGKLYTGSWGTLGVITGAWLRLQPSPRQVEVRVAEFSETATAMRVGVEASRRSSARACVLLSPEVARSVGLEHSLAASWLLLTELAGEVEECRSDAAWLESVADVRTPEGGSGDPAPGWIEKVKEELAPAGESAVRARVAVLPTQLEAICTPLVRTDARLIVSPGVGVVHVELGASAESGGDASRLADLLGLLESASAAAGGQLFLESLPASAKRGRDVFGNAGPAIEIMKKLKREFDPHGVLNPGRFAGGI